MSPRYRLTADAIEDIDAIWQFIAADNVSAANRVKSAIFATCRTLARNPGIGSRRPEITSLPIRFLPVRRYSNFIVAYRPESRPVVILAVLHGRRNLPALFRNTQSME